MCADKLATCSLTLRYITACIAWYTQWHSFREATEKHAQALDTYLAYLRSQSKKMKIHHESPDSPGISVTEKNIVQLLKVNVARSSHLTKLNDALSHKAPYEHVFVADYAPDQREKYRYVQELQKGLCRSCVLRTCSIRGPVGNYLFVWPLPEHVTMDVSLTENQRVISQIQANVPLYHHRALRKKLISKFERISPKTV